MFWDSFHADKNTRVPARFRVLDGIVKRIFWYKLPNICVVKVSGVRQLSVVGQHASCHTSAFSDPPCLHPGSARPLHPKVSPLCLQTQSCPLGNEHTLSTRLCAGPHHHSTPHPCTLPPLGIGEPPSSCSVPGSAGGDGGDRDSVG